jgi:hypothetical protein
MKKIYLSLLVGLSLFSSVKAQKVNLDPFTFNYEHVQLPLNYTDPANRTYNVVTNNGSDYYWVFNNDDFSRKININGFKPVNSGAYINIEVLLENLIIENAGVKENFTKNAAGAMVVSSYTATINCRGVGKCVVNCDGRVSSIPLTYTNKMTSQNYQNSDGAYRYYYDNLNTLKQQFSREFAMTSIDKIFAELNYLYGYRILESRGNLWVLESKDHPDFPGHQDAMTTIRNAFGSLTYTSDPLPVYQSLQPVIKYYEDLIVANNTDDKHHKKMRYSSYYNIMNIYYALDLPEKARVAAEALILNDYDKADGKLMIEKANNLTNILNTNKVVHSHLIVDPIYIR